MNRRNFFKRSTGLAAGAIVASQIKELPKVEAVPIPEPPPIEVPNVPLYTESERSSVVALMMSATYCSAPMYHNGKTWVIYTGDK